MRKMLGRSILAGTLFAGSIVAWCAAAPETPPFKEVYELIRTNAGGIREAELNDAAVDGLLAKVGSRAWRINPSKSSATETNVSPVSSTATFDDHYGYIRVGQVGPKLPEEFSLVLQKLASSNELKGLVLDLRYANG